MLTCHHWTISWHGLPLRAVEIFVCPADPVFRLLKLMREIMREKENKTIIFSETKRKVDEVTRRIKRERCDASHCAVIRHTANVHFLHLTGCVTGGSCVVVFLQHSHVGPVPLSSFA